MGEISWLSSFKTVGGIKSGPGRSFMWFQVGEQFLDAGGRYSDVWHRRVGTGPFVRKGARCFQPHLDAVTLGEFRVGGGVHNSYQYTSQCGPVGYFTSPGIYTPDRRDQRLLVSHPKDTDLFGYK